MLYLQWLMYIHIMARSKSSRAWLQEHFSDHWVQQAQAQGWRSRAAFKLVQLDERLQLLQPGQLVVDLGAAPGSWSQYASSRVGSSGKVIALDSAGDGNLARCRFHSG